MCAWMNGRVGVFNTIFGVSSWGTTKKRVLKFKVHVRVTRWMNTFVFSDNPLEGTTINQPSQKWVEKRRTHIIKCRLGISVLKRKSPFFKIWFEKKILGFRLWRIKCIKRAQLPMQSTLESNKAMNLWKENPSSLKVQRPYPITIFQKPMHLHLPFFRL